jgi:methyl-accepting chemotaxis protein
MSEPRGELALRIKLSLVVMTLLIAAVTVVARQSVGHVMSTTQVILIGDTHASEEALQVLAATLELRRYEKDVFLNIGDGARQADYRKKWDAARERLTSHLDALDRTVLSADDHATLREMRASFGTYAAGFERISAAAVSGEIATPQAANLAMVRYKDAVHSLEATSGAIGSTSAARMDARMDLLRGESARTARLENLMSLVALVIALLVGFRVWTAFRKDRGTATDEAMGG